jgi:hypothetical protein
VNTDAVKRALQQTTGAKLNIEAQPDPDMHGLSIELALDEGVLSETSSIDSIEIDTGTANVTLSTAFLRKRATDAKTVTLSVVKVDSSKLPANVQAQLNGADVYDVQLLIDGQKVSALDGRSDVQVTLPYTLKAGENPHNIVIYYVNDNGGLEVVINGRYNAATGKVEFKPAHLSKYTAAYGEVNFTDVTQGWAKDAIEALAARGIVKGIGEGVYNPNGHVTRAEFITMLMRAYELTDAQATTAFTDVKDGAWYYANIATAQQLGIVNGKLDGSFGVHENITREDMAVMVYMAMKYKQLELATDATATFIDQESIAAYAQQAVAVMQAEGIINGIGNGQFAPKQNASRAQVARLIYNLLSMM